MGKKKLNKSAVAVTPTARDGPGPGPVIGVPAAPRITNPLANAFVPPNVDLMVNVTTNRGDLRYRVVFTPLMPPPSPTTMVIPAPGMGGFNIVIPGANLQPNRSYEIHVFVEPADGPTPPHLDHSINIHTNSPPGFVMFTLGDPDEAA